MSYIINWSTSKLSASRTFKNKEDDGRSRRSDAWNNGSKGAHRTIYKSVQNWMHEISYESSYQPDNFTEVHPRVVRINKRIERFTQMRVVKQLSSMSTQVTNYGIGRQNSLPVLMFFFVN